MIAQAVVDTSPIPEWVATVTLVVTLPLFIVLIVRDLLKHWKDDNR